MSDTYIQIGTINNNTQDNHREMTVNVSKDADVAELIRAFMGEDSKPTKEKPEPEDVSPIDTSFFGTDNYSEDICRKNLMEAIEYAAGKADACRRIMLADTCGYIHIRQFSDARKAELINQFSAPKYVFTDDDFCKARNRMNTK